MNQDQERSVYRAVTDFMRGSPVVVSKAFASGVLQQFRRVSERRRGYVLIAGHWLVRLTEEDEGWVVQRLPQAPVAALNPEHLHSISPVTLKDGWDVLICSECGREW